MTDPGTVRSETNPEPFVTVGELLQSPNLDAFAEALALFQSEAQGAAKGSTAVDYRKDRSGNKTRVERSYASLSDAWASAREPLTKHGLSVMQWPTTPSQGWIAVTTRVLHKSGQWMQATLRMAIDETSFMNPTQKYGSAITYCSRYAYLAALGLPPAGDDDGQSAGGEARSEAYGSSRSGSKNRKPKKNKGTADLERRFKSAPDLAAYRELRVEYEKLNSDQKQLIKPAIMAKHKELTDSKCGDCDANVPIGAELCERCAPPEPPADAPPPLAEEPDAQAAEEPSEAEGDAQGAEGDAQGAEEPQE